MSALHFLASLYILGVVAIALLGALFFEGEGEPVAPHPVWTPVGRAVLVALLALSWPLSLLLFVIQDLVRAVSPGGPRS